MRWLAKATIQKAMSVLPQPDRWNYVLQRHVTKRLPRPDNDVTDKIRLAIRHLEALQRVSPELDVTSTRFFEFGAGWDLIVPLAFATLGVRDQTLVDIRPNARLELVNDAIARIGPLLGRTGRSTSRDLDPAPIASFDELRERFGIRYVAPLDAAATGFSDDTFDVMTSTLALEHIPAPDIEAILREAVRILRPGGLFSAIIDMQDHYSFMDRNVSVYNYLRYGDRTWGLVNSKLHYQNRLRNSDYLALARASGLDLMFEQPTGPTAKELEALQSLPLAPRFRHYERDDLAITDSLVVLRKPSRRSSAAATP